MDVKLKRLANKLSAVFLGLLLIGCVALDAESTDSVEVSELQIEVSLVKSEKDTYITNKDEATVSHSSWEETYKELLQKYAIGDYFIEFYDLYYLLQYHIGLRPVSDLVLLFGTPKYVYDGGHSMHYHFKNNIVVHVGERINSISVTYSPYNHFFHFDGIGAYDIREDVLAIFGEPSQIRLEYCSDNAVVSYVFEVRDYRFVRFFFDDSDLISQIQIFTI